MICDVNIIGKLPSCEKKKEKKEKKKPVMSRYLFLCFGFSFPVWRKGFYAVRVTL